VVEDDEDEAQQRKVYLPLPEFRPYQERDELPVEPLTLVRVRRPDQSEAIVAKETGGWEHVVLDGWRLAFYNLARTPLRRVTGRHVIVQEWSGGAHCCFDYHVLHVLGAEVRREGTIRAGDCALRVADVDRDGDLELVACDSRFAYGFDLPFAESPLVPLVYAYRDKAYVADNRRFPQVFRFRIAQERRRRDAEAAVIESKRRFHTITDNLPGVVYQRLLTGAGEISYPFFSARVQELFGVTAEEAMADASKILNAIHVDDFDRLTASIKESAQQLSVWDHEYRVVRKDGPFRWMHAKAVPHRRENGDVVWDGIITDETERKIAEMSLGVTNQLLTSTNQRLSTMYETAHHFVDNVAHEFRTPLTVIKEFASIMDEGLVGELNAEQSDYLRVICARVDDLNGLVNDMLDLSRLEAGLIGVSRRECALSDIVGRVETILERRAKASNVDFAVEIEAGLPALFCDPEKIGRVLINLGINAFKYGGDKGGVRLWARRSGNPREIVIGVSDRGPGIPAEKLGMIFERFKQAGGLRDTAKGFGLGLSIVRELADLNLGEIAVESVVGEGTTFSLTLPVFDPPAIVARYIAKLVRERTSSFYVSDTRISVSGAADTAAAADCEAFLQQQVKREDLLMRLGPDSWILLTVDKRDADLRAKADQLRDGLAGHAAEIADGALTVEAQPVGVWRLPHQSEALIARFRALRDMAQARRSA
jgi:PAS domain S-box-containing protein